MREGGSVKSGAKLAASVSQPRPGMHHQHGNRRAGILQALGLQIESSRLAGYGWSKEADA